MENRGAEDSAAAPNRGEDLPAGDRPSLAAANAPSRWPDVRRRRRPPTPGPVGGRSGRPACPHPRPHARNALVMEVLSSRAGQGQLEPLETETETDCRKQSEQDQRHNLLGAWRRGAPGPRRGAPRSTPRGMNRQDPPWGCPDFGQRVGCGRTQLDGVKPEPVDSANRKESRPSRRPR